MAKEISICFTIKTRLEVTMQINKINNTPFNGLLTISGPNKNLDIIVNTNAISTINTQPYIGTKEDSVLGIGNRKGAVLMMNNDAKVNTFVPTENIVEAYKQAKKDGEATIESKYNPIMEKPLIG